MKYKTRFGVEYDLSRWPKEHREFVQRAYWHYTMGMDYDDFIPFILGVNSPVMNRKKNGPAPTRTPLYEVATDLQFRLAVKQGRLEKDWEGEVDPKWEPNG